MADTEILRHGEWDSQRFRASGAMLVEVLAPSTLRAGVAVDGLQGAMRSQSTRSGAFPLQAVPEEVHVLAVTQTREPFPGGARVDLSVAFPSTARSFLIQNVDIAGHERAPLVRLSREGDAWLLSPNTSRPGSSQQQFPHLEERGAPAPGGAEVRAGSKEPPAVLGSWAARRAAELGSALQPQIAELVIDTSVSMSRHRSRVRRLCSFASALARSSGMAEPRVRTVSVGGSDEAGVGSLLDGDAEGRADDLLSTHQRRIVITDLPIQRADVHSLVIGDPAILAALAVTAGEVFVLDASAWSELEREDASYTDQTLQRLEPLMRWLALPSHETKESS